MRGDDGEDDGQQEPEESEASRAEREALAGAETRVLSDDAPPVSSRTPQGTPESDSEAATVLSADDDRTQLVSRESIASREPARPEPAATAPAKTTRVLDEAPPRAPAGTTAETRVLDENEDKTSPPPVAGPVSPRPAASPPIDPDRGLEPGMVLFGEYEIVNVLGVGGMGEVYRARHRRLDEHRAIKVMHAELSKKKGASEFFYREAKALLAVRHPAVVHCHDLLSDDEGRVYLIMEMIEGIPLSKRLNDGPMSADDVAILGARVAHGLSAAHRKGVIHRDVSPDNIVLPNGRVQEAKLIDFGIAKILEEGEGTIVDGFKGKLSYASPEQLGFFGGKMGGSSDFYSLGLVLVAAALGRPMSMGTTVMEAVDARRAFQVLPDDIPVGLRSAIQPLLALDPKDRPKFVDRLFVVPGGTEGGTDPGGYARSHAGPSEAARSTSSVRFGTGLFAAGVASAALLAGGGFYLATRGDAPSTSAATSAAAIAPAVVTETEPTKTPESVVEAEADTTAKAGVVAPEPMAAAAVEPAKPPVRRVTGTDRLKIIGLLNSARLAVEENRLMSPAGDNAFDRYRAVLSIDPTNQKAKDGLHAVASRYLDLSTSAAARGDDDQARTFLDRAREAEPGHPDLAATEARLSR